MPTSGINNDEIKRRAQYMNMRAAQLASEQQNIPQTLGTEKPTGSKKQLIGTVAGIVAVVLLLLLLSYFRII